MNQGQMRNLTRHEGLVKTTDFERMNGHRGAVVWLTGLSAAGKSTIAREVEWILFEREVRTIVLDGDNIRHGLNKDLGFSAEDRMENIRRIGEVARLFRDTGMIVVTAFISPFESDRQVARALLPQGDFFEVYVKANLDTCMRRDPKGLYKKAVAGQISDFTGISSPYEEPYNSELVIETDGMSVSDAAQCIVRLLESRGVLPIHSGINT